VMASGDDGGRVLLWRPLASSQGEAIDVPGRESIEALSLSADAARLTVVQPASQTATGGRVGATLRVFDTGTGSLVAQRESTTTGEFVALASDGQTVLVLDGFAGQELDAFTLVPRRPVQLQPVGAPPAACSVFDGERLFSPCFRTLQVWHVGTGEVRVLHEAFDKAVQSAVAADRSGTAAFATPDGLFLADAEPLRVRRIDRGRHEFDRLAVDGTGTFVVAVGADHTLRAWNAKTGLLTCQTFGRHEAGRVVAVASRRLLTAVGGTGGALALFGMFGSNDRQTLVGHSGIVSKLAVTAGGALLSASHEPAVRAWHPASGAPKAANYTPRHWVNALAVSADGQHAFAAHHDAISRLRLPQLVADGEIEVGGWVMHLFALPDGRLVALLPDRLVDVDMAGQVVRATVAVPGGKATAACASPDGRHAMIVVDGAVQHWSLADGLALRASLPVAGASAIVCSSDGQSLFTSEQRWLRRRRVDGGEVVWERACARAVTSLLLLADESRLVAGHEDGTVSLWNPDDCSCMATLLAGNARIRALAADPRGRWLAAADEHATVTLFRACVDDEGFPARLARADAMAATWLDEEMRRDLRAQSLVLAAIAAGHHFDDGLRQAMEHAERLRPQLTWEAIAEQLNLSRDPAQSAPDYERALRLAELALQDQLDFGIARMAAAFATLRLGRAGAALQHADQLLQQLPATPGWHGPARAIRALAFWQLHRQDEARSELAAAEHFLGALADADDVRLLDEVRRVVRR